MYSRKPFRSVCLYFCTPSRVRAAEHLLFSAYVWLFFWLGSVVWCIKSRSHLLRLEIFYCGLEHTQDWRHLFIDRFKLKTLSCLLLSFFSFWCTEVFESWHFFDVRCGCVIKKVKNQGSGSYGYASCILNTEICFSSPVQCKYIENEIILLMQYA